MAKNRKAESTAVRLVPAIKVFLLCAFIGSTAVGYVFQKEQITQLGKEINQREKQLRRLREQNRMDADRLAALTSPPALKARVERLNLGLVQPPLSQIVRLVEVNVKPVPNRLGEGAERLLTQATR